MYNDINEIMKIQDVKERTAALKRYEIMTKAKRIAEKRFIDDVKYIYTKCTPQSLNDGYFDALCENLGFCEKDTIDRNINSVALSELIQHKNNLGAIIYDIIDHIRELNEQNQDISYNILVMHMLCIVGTKQDILNLYACMLARLKLDLIKDIQHQLNR